jgi:hypothetical protein
MKLDWKKDDKRYYLPKAEPEELFVPAFKFFAIDGAGDPNGQEFPSYIEALYAASYAVKMSPKKGKAPPDYADYTVYPLEGVWDISDEAKARGGAWDKSSLVFTLMMRQPGFLSEDLALATLEDLAAAKAKTNPLIARLRFQVIEEGPCVQMLHLGPYDDEPASFARMEAYAAARGLVRRSKIHREIYLSDARRVEPAKLRTVLRFRV